MEQKTRQMLHCSCVYYEQIHSIWRGAGPLAGHVFIATQCLQIRTNFFLTTMILIVKFIGTHLNGNNNILDDVLLIPHSNS